MLQLAERQGAIAAALLDPALPVPLGLLGPAGEPSPRRFAVYRNNVVASLSRVLATGVSGRLPDRGRRVLPDNGPQVRAIGATESTLAVLRVRAVARPVLIDATRNVRWAAAVTVVLG